MFACENGSGEKHKKEESHKRSKNKYAVFKFEGIAIYDLYVS